MYLVSPACSAARIMIQPPSGHLSIVSFDGKPVSSNVPSERFEGFFLTCTLVGNAIEFRRRKRAYRNRLLLLEMVMAMVDRSWCLMIGVALGVEWITATGNWLRQFRVELSGGKS